MRDLAVDVDEQIEAGQIETEANAANQPLLSSVTWFETYRGQGLEQGKKSLTFHLTFRAQDRTLASEEVDAAMQVIRERLAEKVGATFRG